MQSDEDRDAFITEKRDTYTAEIEPWGSVEVEVRDPVVIVCASAGGWCWEASGPDRASALRHLESRMESTPWKGVDTDWGLPGHQEDKLSEAIPSSVRRDMIAYQLALDPNRVDDDDVIWFDENQEYGE